MVFPWGVYTNGAVELGVVLNSRAFWVWSTVLTLILVILWIANAFASIVGVSNGKLLELDRGWRAMYYMHSAEEEKEAAGQDHQQSDGGGQVNGHHRGSGGPASLARRNGNGSDLRQRDR